jgi:spore coat protein CotH
MIAVLAATVLAAQAASPVPDRNPFLAKPSKKPKLDLATQFFTNTHVPRLEIEIKDPELGKLKANNRLYVKATVKDGDTTYTDVAVHLKGGAGSFRPLDQNPALTLNFDKFHREQRFHGLDKIHLNNSVQDPSFCTEGMCAELMRAAGVPALRTTHARVKLNGRDLGLYVLKEGYDHTFLKKHFLNPYGTFYDGGFCQDIDQKKQKISNDDRKDQKDLQAVWDAVREPDPVKRWQRLTAVLDVDRFLSFATMEAMTAHWDGYAYNKNNYRLYHDPTTDKIVFLPSGMDQMFGDGVPLTPNGAGFVAKALYDTPEGKTRWHDRLETLFKTYWNANELTQQARRIQEKIRPALSEAEAKNHANAVNDLVGRITQRTRTIERFLGVPVQTLKFNDAGVASLGGWSPVSHQGNPAIEEAKDGGNPVLRIRANSGDSVGSWRTRVLLKNGRYLFEGAVRTAGVQPMTDGGACIRVSGGTSSTKIKGDTGWQRMTFELQVDEPVREVELVCELRANKGESLFDPKTLRLVKQN